MPGSQLFSRNPSWSIKESVTITCRVSKSLAVSYSLRRDPAVCLDLQKTAEADCDRSGPGCEAISMSNKIFFPGLPGASKITSFYSLSNMNPAVQCPPEVVTLRCQQRCQHQASPTRHKEDTGCSPKLQANRQAFKFSGLAQHVSSRVKKQDILCCHVHWSRGKQLCLLYSEQRLETAHEIVAEAALQEQGNNPEGRL